MAASGSGRFAYPGLIEPPLQKAFKPAAGETRFQNHSTCGPPDSSKAQRKRHNLLKRMVGGNGLEPLTLSV